MNHQTETERGFEIAAPSRLTREALRDEFIKQAVKAPKNDPYIRAFSEAFDAIYDEPAVAEMVDMFLEIRQLKRPMLRWHAHNHIFRAVQAQLIRREEQIGYPQNFSYATDWIPELHGLLETGHSRDIGFEVDLLIHSVQSNVSGRYRSMAMILDALQDRYPSSGDVQTVTALDVACSLNRGYTHLASDIPFDPIIEAQHAHLPTVNRRIQNRIHFENSLGVDLKSLNDENTRWWAEACSMYPSERLDRRLVSTYQALDSLEVPGLSFEDADFVETGPEGRWDPAGALHPSRAHMYDVVTMYTFLYQLSAEEYEKALHHAQAVVKPDGIIIIQDFMNTLNHDWHAVTFNSSSEEWSYRTFALDMQQREAGLQPLFVWNNGRCERLRVPIERHDSKMKLQHRVFSSVGAV